MTDKFYDSQGVPIGGYEDGVDPDGTPVEWSPEYEAEYKAKGDRALEIAARFQMLADAAGDYWPAIEMEIMARHSLRNHRAANIWKDIVAKKRARFYAQIRQEMNEDDAN